MDTMNFDELANNYKQATERWIEAIREEEALTNPDHSMKEMERWDAVGLKIHDAEAVAKKARDAYKNALRKKNYGF